MKRALLLILVAGILVFLIYLLTFNEDKSNGRTTEATEPDAKTAGRELLSVADIDLGGKSGKITVLDFWASWCGPCKLQMPVMERFYNSLADPECIQLIAVNVGESRATVENFLSKNHVSYNVALDKSRELADKYRVTAIPTTVILDAGGKAIEIKPGYFPDLDSYLKGKIHPLAPDCVPQP
jgi:thiol-disulfide isomerase/thioredoxin